MDIEFLNGIELKELEGKDEVVKSVRFAKEDFYLLKYLALNNKKFSYVKELIERDLAGTLDVPATQISKTDIKNMIKETLRDDEELKEIIRDILKEDESVNIQVGKNKELEDAKNDISNFMS